LEHKIIAYLEEIFKIEGFEDCFLVEISQGGNHKLTVFLDSDSGMSFGKCQKISRQLEARIEEEGMMPEKYTLDVSSPGIERPLKFKRQYIKNVGRKMEVLNVEGESYVGELTEVHDDRIKLEYKERIKEGKKKKTVIIEKEILFDSINKAIVKAKF